MLNGEYNKAFAAIIPPILMLLKSIFGIEVPFLESPETQIAIAGVLSTILVWLVPNKAKPTPTA